MSKTPSKMPSIKAVARRAGVSPATVSNVLTARRGVTPELADRVRAAVAELGYIADQAASRLRSQRCTVAGVLVPDIANPFFAAFVAAVESAARTDGFDLLIVSSGDDPDREAARLRALLTWRPAGVIVVPCDDAFAARSAAADSFPIVAADRVPTHADFDVIGIDNRGFAAAAAAHLVEGGYRSMLVVASSLGIDNVQERFAGAQEAARRSGVDVAVDVLEVGFRVPASRAKIAARLAAGALPDAVFALNNLATLASFEALTEAGLRVPREVALLGFDDDEWMHVTTPPITAVVQPVEEMGRQAWKRLTARIGGETGPPVAIKLDCRLEVRGSTQRRHTSPKAVELSAAAHS
jgi:LacI family transcriptional regulator